jgi:hypothetical protein
MPEGETPPATAIARGASAKRDIVFVIERGKQRAGSAHLRGYQLAKLFSDVARDYGHSVRVALSDEETRNAIAIVNKPVPKPTPNHLVDQLKAAGCTVLVDFVDRRIEQSAGDAADGFLAVSAAQYRHLRARWPEKPTIHLPHHVDLDIPQVRCQWDDFACAYFGNLGNAEHLDAVQGAGLIEVVQTLTANKNNWHAELPRFNLHYAFRPRIRWGAGFKPFTKGFIAAHVGAVPVVATCDEEATELLGADYPFRIAGDADAQTVIARLQAMRSGFGDRAWRTARHRMRRLRAISSAHYLRSLIRSHLFEAGPQENLFR